MILGRPDGGAALGAYWFMIERMVMTAMKPSTSKRLFSVPLRLRNGHRVSLSEDSSSGHIVDADNDAEMLFRSTRSIGRVKPA